MNTSRLFKIFALSVLVLTGVCANAQNRIEKLRADYDSLGNVSGAYLFPKEKGANLRILDMNVWEWDGTRDKLPPAWAAIGEDCTNEVRSIGFAGIITAHLPEVVCLQEYSPEMHLELYPKLQKAGYQITFLPGPDEVNFTPILYLKSRVKLLETAYYPHALPYNNGRTKSFTTAVFQMKKGGKSEKEIFASFNDKCRMRIFTFKGEVDTMMTPRDSILHHKRIMRASLVAMDPRSGHVKAYVGGPNFRYFKYEMAKQGKRQTGSTAKPFIYTFAIDQLGLTPCTMAPNLPVSIETPAGIWSPKEAGNVEYDGVLHPLYWGLANSRNNYSAWIMKQAKHKSDSRHTP